MSKLEKWFFALFILCFGALFFGTEARAQDLSLTVRILEDRSMIEVEGEFLNRNQVSFPKNFAFVNSDEIIGKPNERVSELILSDEKKQEISFRKFSTGEFLAASEPTYWKYKIDIESRSGFSEKAHSSWLKDNNGILMLRDLLPSMNSVNKDKVSARVILDVPSNWKIICAENRRKNGAFEIPNFENAVFIVGEVWREHRIALDGVAVDFAIMSEWRFTDIEASEMIKEILTELGRIFGGYPNSKIQITLVPLPNNIGRWEGETRGNSVTIISGDMNFKKPSLQRLHEQLRHELLHLWIPNGLALTGNYDWYYEGFLIYQSLKTGLAMNRLSFDDFLDTLAEAYAIANVQQPFPLYDESSSKKSGTNQQVYARGMLVGFICDAAILTKSRAKRSISDVFRSVYQTHRISRESKEGNSAILKILSEYQELEPIIKKYIFGAEPLVWDDYLKTLGIVAVKSETGVGLKVHDKLTGRQKDLLDELGYNNWRKIGKKS